MGVKDKKRMKGGSAGKIRSLNGLAKALERSRVRDVSVTKDVYPDGYTSYRLTGRHIWGFPDMKTIPYGTAGARYITVEALGKRGRAPDSYTVSVVGEGGYGIGTEHLITKSFPSMDDVYKFLTDYYI